MRNYFGLYYQRERERERDRSNEKNWVRVIIKIDQYMIRLKTTTQTLCINNFIRKRNF